MSAALKRVRCMLLCILEAVEVVLEVLGILECVRVVLEAVEVVLEVTVGWRL